MSPLRFIRTSTSKFPLGGNSLMTARALSVRLRLVDRCHAREWDRHRRACPQPGKPCRATWAVGPFLDGLSAVAVEEVPERTWSQLQVAFEELIINAIRHGECEPKNSAIRLAIWREGDQISAEFSDSGVAFNPLEAPPLRRMTPCSWCRSRLDRPMPDL